MTGISLERYSDSEGFRFGLGHSASTQQRRSSRASPGTRADGRRLHEKLYGKEKRKSDIESDGCSGAEGAEKENGEGEAEED